MSTSNLKLQVNSRAGYIDTAPQEEPLRHYVNYDEDDGDILLPTQFNGKSKNAEQQELQNNTAEDSEMLFPIGINPK